MCKVATLGQRLHFMDMESASSWTLKSPRARPANSLRESRLGQNYRKSAKFVGNSSRPSIGVKPLQFASFGRNRLQYLRMWRGLERIPSQTYEPILSRLRVVPE